MNESKIVCGPQACGKTRNMGRIAAHYGLWRIVDDWDGSTRPIATGHLYLTNRDAAEISEAHPDAAANVVEYRALPATAKD